MPQDEFRKGLSLAARIGSEFVAATVVGGGLGYLGDRLFGTRPWLLAAGLFLGTAAGVLAAYREASRMSGGDSVPDDEN
jgi:ATP synthase protein I